ncbi:MAG TPA: hypothetical protein VHT34_05745 [Clostridia bacterium]|nr:hypothetical protein [Clostridia bacterium]
MKTKRAARAGKNLYKGKYEVIGDKGRALDNEGRQEYRPLLILIVVIKSEMALNAHKTMFPGIPINDIHRTAAYRTICAGSFPERVYNSTHINTFFLYYDNLFCSKIVNIINAKMTFQ